MYAFTKILMKYYRKKYMHSQKFHLYMHSQKKKKKKKKKN